MVRFNWNLARCALIRVAACIIVATMSATTVTVLCPNGRRVNVKATPSTVLLQVLEQVCSKQKLDPTYHVLKHHNKVLDLDCSYRYSSLPQNARLDLEFTDRPRSKEGTVVLAVQTEDGSRHQAEFSPSASLWDVLLELRLLQDRPPPLGGRSGVEQQQPVVVYMSHQVEGQAGLQDRTLRALGISSGRAIVRLLFRPCSSEHAHPPEQLKPSAESKRSPSLPAAAAAPKVSPDTTLPSTAGQSQPPAVLPPDEEPRHKPPPPPPSHTEPMEEEDLPYFPAHPISIFPEDTMASASLSNQQQPGPLFLPDPHFSQQQPGPLFLPEQVIPHIVAAMQPFKFPDGPVVSKQATPPQPARTYDEPCDREQVVYRRDNALPVTPNEELPPAFFDVTVADMHKMHSDLKKQVKLADAPLLTSAMRQAKLERQGSQYNRSVLRVCLPDGWVLQGCFRPRESLKAAVRFVRENLADPKTKFHLYTAPPKNILRSGRLTLLEAGFVPAALLYVGLEEGVAAGELLAPHCLQLAQSSLQAHLAASRRRDDVQLPPPDTAALLSQPDSTQPDSTQPGLAPTSTSSLGGPAAVGGGARHTTTAASGGQPKWFKLGKK